MNIAVGHGTAALLVATTLALAACGGNDAASYVASAKDYLAKGDAVAAVVELKNAVRENPDSAETRYLIGLAMRRASDLAGAEVELRKALTLGHDRNLVLPELAAALFDSGDYDKTLKETETEPLATPDAQAAVLAIKGDALGALGRVDAARAAYDLALTANPKNERATIGIARLAMAAGEADKAERIVAGVLAANPKAGTAWVVKAQIELRRGRQAEAIDAYGKALDAKPDELIAHAELIPLLVNRGRLDDAVSRLAAMKKIAPGAPATAYADAVVSYAKGDTAHAREAAQFVLKSAPADNRARLIGGVIEHDLGNFAMADKLLTAVVQTAPDDRRARHMLASTQLRMARAADARKTLDPLLAAPDPGIPTLLLAGEIAMRLRDQTQAMSYFGKAIALDPKRPDSLIARAQALFAQGRFDDGAADVAAATAADPGQAAADALLIQELLRNGQTERARAAADALVKRLPENAEAQNALGLAAHARGDNAAAQSAFEKAVKLAPRFLPAVKNLASAELDAGKTASAIGRLRALVALDPSRADAVVLLVAALQRTGASPGDVLPVIDTALLQNIRSLDLNIAKIDYLLHRGDAKEALDAALAGQAAFPDEPAILYALARSQQAAGETPQALATYSKLSAALPRSAIPYLGMAEAHAASQNWVESRAALRQAIKVAPDELPAYLGLVKASLAGTALSQARDDARAVQKKWPSRPEGWAYEAIALDRMKDGAGAEKVLRDGLAASGASELLGQLYGRLLSQNRAPDAENVVTTWVAKHPGDVRAMMSAGEIRQARGEYKEAEAWFRRALALRGNDAIVLNNLAWTLGKLGDRTALDFGKRALAASPDSPAILDTVGVLNVQFGNRDEGIRQLEAAVARAPTDASIRVDLARALIQADKKKEAREQLDDAARLKPAGRTADEIAELNRSL